MNELRKTSDGYDPQALLDEYPGQVLDLGRMFSQIENVEDEIERLTLQRTMMRYLLEGENNSYNTDPGALVKLIKDEQLLKGVNRLMDLGAGPGQLIAALASNNPDLEQVAGIDISPSFVERFNAQQLEGMSMRAGLIDQPFNTLPELLSTSAVISCLTLDRLANPQILLENMSLFRRKVLVVLLPNQAEDDNPSRQGEGKIIYTQPKKRIVPGLTREEDREILMQKLPKIWGSKVQTASVDYVVESSGDRQVYNLDAFWNID